MSFRLHHRGGQRIYFMERSGGGLLVLGASDKDGQDLEIARCVQRRKEYKEQAKLSRKLEQSFKAAKDAVTINIKLVERLANSMPKPKDRQFRATARRRADRGGMGLI